MTKTTQPIWPLTDLDRQAIIAGKIELEGKCRLSCAGGRFRFRHPLVTSHSLNVTETDWQRLNAHWQGFVTNCMHAERKAILEGGK